MKRVLFLCTGNSCRSQMAEGWTRHLYGDLYEIYSTGTAPLGIDPRAVAVMAESGVDISAQTSNHVDEYLNIFFDLVVTVCDSARESCPVFPGGGETLHYSFDDPPFLARNAQEEEEALIHYRRVRDEIREFVAGISDLF
ncbi:MAG: arsenate reductase ArsC [bacterium]|nr:arsenate reductase ArsC [bacterium]